ncbi:nucleoside triphosphate pyrophosphatase [Alloiococcus sp. CFN-8]|uniref:nucleoside triphosphate pyrophosphatase n=1 Tax=Alloiococcus sp. CFN-8 TaxID=3416081 RepID=UPI003CF584E1
MKIVLASSSPRRKELMNKITSEFEIVVSNFNEETVEFNGNPCEYVIELSKRKAKEVLKAAPADSIIIGADTVVAQNNMILGKPKSREEAYNMLQSLSDSWHEVFTGVTVISKNSLKEESQCTATRVKFSPLTEEEISAYLDSEDYMSFAGAYGIQGAAGIFVEQIIGDYYNIVGLPINKLNCMLKTF